MFPNSQIVHQMPFGHVVTTTQHGPTLQLQHHPADLKVCKINSHSKFNKLISLPDCIGQLTNLTTLICSNNQLTPLPDCIGQLINLTSLDLRFNHLTSLSDSIGQLINLESLDLGDNQLT